MLRQLCCCFSYEQKKKDAHEDLDREGEKNEQEPILKSSPQATTRPGILKNSLSSLNGRKPSEENKEKLDEDSGACVDDQSKLNSLENVSNTSSCDQRLLPLVAGFTSADNVDVDHVQLTVSSVNTILEDLVEVDAEEENAHSHEEKFSTAPASVNIPTTHQTAAAKIFRPCPQVQSRPSARQRSPACVSFDDNPTIVEPSRQRSRSDATRFRFRSPSSSFSSGTRGKVGWLRERQKLQQQKAQTELPCASNEDFEFCCGRDGLIEYLEDQASKAPPMQKKHGKWFDVSLLHTNFDKPMKRPRTKSDRLERKSNVLAEISKTTAIDWPLGHLGKFRQKCKERVVKLQQSTESEGAKPGALGKSASAGALTEKEIEKQGLKRQGSDRSKGDATAAAVAKRKVAFEEQSQHPGLAVSFFNASIRFLMGDSGTRTRRRRYTYDPGVQLKIIEPEQRRRAASLSTPHRRVDINIDHELSTYLFRNARGEEEPQRNDNSRRGSKQSLQLPQRTVRSNSVSPIRRILDTKGEELRLVLQLPVNDPFVKQEGFQNLKSDENRIFSKFFLFHKCYDLIPTSAKLVVFDTQLLVKKAFYALVYNGVRAAPLWDSAKHKFVGMLTITDFIRILKMYYKEPSVEMDELEEQKLDTWRNALNDVKDLIFIDPDASLLQAIRTLVQNKIHRLPIIDPKTGNVLYILTHKRLLRFLFLYIHDLPKPSYFDKTIEELKLGTYSNIVTTTYETTIIEALTKFVESRVSALPIVDEEGKLVDIYAKFDVINLAAEKTYNNLDVSLREANQYRNEWFEGVYTCKKTDTLFHVMENIVKAEVHRLVIVNDEKQVIGIISLSDILSFLVFKTSENTNDEQQKSDEPVANSTNTTKNSEETGETKLSKEVEDMKL